MLTPLLFVLLAQQTLPNSISTPSRELLLQGRTHHVQGIDTDGVTLWVTSVDRTTRKGYLMAFSAGDGRMEGSTELQEGERFHPGGISADGDSIWLPVAEYRAKSTSVIQKRNRRTFELEFQFTVDDHIGCIAVTPDVIIGGNWDSREFYIWDHKGTLLRKVANATGNSYQDLKWVRGQVVASGTLADRHGAVDWLKFPEMSLDARVGVGNTAKGEPFTREGMTVFGKELWLLPEDDTSRLFVFSLSPRP